MKYLILAVLFISICPANAHAATLARPTNNLGLSAYWSFDQGTSTKVTDQSGRGHTLTLTTTGSTLPTWNTGRFGKGLTFDGSTNYTTIPTVTDLSFPDQTFTVSFWIKESAAPGGWIITNAAVSGGWGVRDDGLVFLKNVSNSQNTYGISGVTLTDNKWHHLVYVITTSTTVVANNVVTAYVDGAAVSVSGTPTVTYSTQTNFSIGSRNSGQNFWSGTIDEVRIYGRGLSAAEVLSLYKKGLSVSKQVPRSGLVGEWLFNEGAGTRAKDSSGSGNTGVFTGSAAWTMGRHGKAATGQYVNMTTSNRLPTSAITVSAWVKLNTNKNWNNFVRKNWTAVSGSWLLYSDVNGSVKFGIYDTAQRNSFSSVNIVPGKWYHVVGTYDGTSLVNVYVNGVVGTSATTPSPVALDTSSGAFVFDINNNSDGAIDDVRIYNRQLSTSEILALYQERATGVNTSQNNKLTNGLVGLWSFDGADIGNSIIDRSGSGNNGYLVGGNNATSSRKVIGKIGQAFSFGGANTGGISLGTSPTLTPSRFTVAAWVYTPTTTSYNYNQIFSNDRDCCGTYNGIGFAIVAGKVSGNIWNSAQYNISSNATIPASTWTHVAFTYDGATKALYINGVLDKANAQTVDPATPATYGTYIGSMGHSAGTVYTFNGKLDDVRLYNRALSASEIKQLYLMGK